VTFAVLQSQQLVRQFYLEPQLNINIRRFLDCFKTWLRSTHSPSLPEKEWPSSLWIGGSSIDDPESVSFRAMVVVDPKRKEKQSLGHFQGLGPHPDGSCNLT
jgi:hypothetical protein